MTNDHEYILLLIADALDISPDKLPRSAKTREMFAELFVTSPHSGRKKKAMICARLKLTDALLGSLHRMEVDDALNTDPLLANLVLHLLEQIRDSVGCIARNCEKAAMTVAAFSTN